MSWSKVHEVARGELGYTEDPAGSNKVRVKTKNAVFGRYPSCDLLNNALRSLRDGNVETAISEIVFAIDKAGGYFHEDIIPFVNDARTLWR